MIGDRAADLEAGRRAGARSILVLTGEGNGAGPGEAAFVANDFASAAEFILEGLHVHNKLNKAVKDGGAASYKR